MRHMQRDTQRELETQAAKLSQILALLQPKDPPPDPSIGGMSPAAPSPQATSQSTCVTPATNAGDPEQGSPATG